MAVESAREKEKRKIRYSSAKETAEKQQRGFEPASLKVPKGFQLFRFREEKVYKLDVIPFIAGNGNPMAEPGVVHFERTYYTHNGIGTEPKAHYTCPSKFSNNKMPCPICEHVNKLQMDGVDDKVIQAFRPKKRQLWCFIDTKDRDKGIQIFEGSYYRGLGEAIDAKIDATDEDSPKRDFFHLDKGLTLYISIKKEGFKSDNSAGTFMAISNIEMEPRVRQYDRDMLEKTPCLDDIIKVLSYDELHEIFHQSGTKAKPEDKPERNGKLKPSDEETDETAADLGIKEGSKVRTKKHGICEVLHISGDGTSLKLEDEEGEVHSGIAPSSCMLIDDEDDEPEDDEDEDDEHDDRPAKAKPKAKVRPKEDDEDDEDDDDEGEQEDEEEDDEPEDDDDFDDDEDDEPEDEEEDSSDDDEDETEDDTPEDDEEEDRPKPKSKPKSNPKKQDKPKSGKKRK